MGSEESVGDSFLAPLLVESVDPAGPGHLGRSSAGSMVLGIASGSRSRRSYQHSSTCG